MYDVLFYLKLISGLQGSSPKEIAKLAIAGYDRKKGYGFIETEITKTFVQTTLVYERPIVRRLFDPSSGHFLIEQQTIYNQASFEIHPAQMILQSYSGGAKLQKVILALSEVFKQQISIADVFVNIPRILNELEKQKIKFTIIGFTANNFHPEVGVIGRFTASTTNSRIARKIINSYGSDILEIQIEITGDKPSYWVISSFGKVNIKSSSKDSLTNEIELLRKLIMENQDA
jgi:hypothetical protein